VLRTQPVCAFPGCNQRATDVDHIVALSRGGLRSRDPICKGCVLSTTANVRARKGRARGTSKHARSAGKVELDGFPPRPLSGCELYKRSLPEAARVVGYVEFIPVTPSKRLGDGI
jgi:hypothetical protein